ncbi:MAG: Nitrate reductase gamma subunit [Candidatus Kentron sp. G]|nr:MAG: Nitrate reductase gamma subunit [Candidatus Kentron sp. G]VFM97008.1 MAG: Nitrate reductase gamma subunit [Candidatus Kentron sp. G]
MSVLTITYMSLFYGASLVFVAGLLYRISRYVMAPAPLKIPTTPAPLGRRGVVLRLFWEVVLFRSLFRSAKWIWLFGWMFHLALFVVLLRHLRYFTDPVWVPVELLQPFGVYAGFVMVAGLAALWVRRFFVARVRYVSAVSDHLMLALLVAIIASGLVMKYGVHTDIVALKEFTLGIVYFDFPFSLPGTGEGETPNIALLVHLFLVAMLMFLFPFSKLLHAPGLFFCPTRNQIDNPRAEPGLRSHGSRHVARWALNSGESVGEPGV